MRNYDGANAKRQENEKRVKIVQEQLPAIQTSRLDRYCSDQDGTKRDLVATFSAGEFGSSGGPTRVDIFSRRRQLVVSV